MVRWRLHNLASNNTILEQPTSGDWSESKHATFYVNARCNLIGCLRLKQIARRHLTDGRASRECHSITRWHVKLTSSALQLPLVMRTKWSQYSIPWHFMMQIPDKHSCCPSIHDWSGTQVFSISGNTASFGRAPSKTWMKEDTSMPELAWHGHVCARVFITGQTTTTTLGNLTWAGSQTQTWWVSWTQQAEANSFICTIFHWDKQPHNIWSCTLFISFISQ